MPTLYVTEFSTMGQVTGAQQMGQEPPSTPGYSIAITGASVLGPVFNSKTRFIELNTDSACSIEIGTNPTAAGTARRMSPNQTIYRAVPENGNYRVAVIVNS